MYAERKGWDLGDVEVDVEIEYGAVERPERVRRRRCELPAASTEEQRERLRVIAGKCPVHRALTGETEVTITDRVELRR